MSDNTPLLNATETEVLELLTKRAESSAGSLAKLSGLKRPTVYAALEGLRRVGLISSHRARGTTVFRPASPALARSLFMQSAQRDFDRKSAEAERLVQRLEVMSTSKTVELSGYEVEAVDSSDAVHSALRQLLIEGNYSAIFNPQIVMQGAMKPFVHNCLIENAKRGTLIRELCVPGKMTDWYVDRIENKNHHVRLLAEKVEVMSDLILADKTVYLLHYEKNKELGIRIRQGESYKTLMSIFEMCWEMARVVR